MNKQPNVIFIVVDTLRADHLKCYGYKKNISPNIDKIAQQGVLFRNCFVNSIGTESAFTTIATGISPFLHGILKGTLQNSEDDKKRFIKLNFKMLAEIMKSKNYVTIGLDWLGRWHKKGFDFYYDPSDRDKKMKRERFLASILERFPRLKSFISKIYSKKLGFLRRKISGFTDGKLLTDLALQMIEKNKDRKIFLFLHFWDVHSPYTCPKNFVIRSDLNNLKVEDMLQSITNKKLADIYHAWWGKLRYTSEIIDLYDGCVNKVDFHIGRIYQKLNELRLLDNTILIITGDHGESMTEHGVYFTHHKLHDEIAHIPLIISYPPLANKNVINESLIQQISITPTILDLLEISDIGYEFDGISLKSCLLKNKVLDTNFILIGAGDNGAEEYAIRTKKYKFIQLDHKNKCALCLEYHGNKDLLFDLKKDPLELNNISEEKEEISQEFRNLIAFTLKSLSRKKEELVLRNKIKNIKL